MRYKGQATNTMTALVPLTQGETACFKPTYRSSDRHASFCPTLF